MRASVPRRARSCSRAWQSGIGRAMNGRAKSSSTRAPRHCPMRNCWRSCCAPGRPDTRRSMLRASVLKSFRSLRKLIAADRRRFCAEPGLGPARFAELQAAVEIARRQTLRNPASRAFAVESPRHPRFSHAQLRDLEHEVFCCLYLDKRHRLIRIRGTVSRHHRWRQRASARDRQAGAAAQLGRGDHRAQSSLGQSPSPARPMNSSPSGSRKRSRSSTYGCWITSSWGMASACHWPNVDWSNSCGLKKKCSSSAGSIGFVQ